MDSDLYSKAPSLVYTGQLQSRTKNQESNLVQIVNRINNIVNDHIMDNAFEIHHLFHNLPAYIMKCRHTLHVQLWKKPFSLRNITATQKKLIVEDTD